MKLALFYVIIIGLFSVSLCTENSILFSSSISLIFTFTGVFVGQLLKNRKRFHVSADKLWVLSGLFLLAVLISLCIYYYDNEQNKVKYILLINLILASCSVLYIYVTREKV